MNGILHHLRSDHLSGSRGGMVSVCSARREVLEAAMELAKAGGESLLVEATAHQVNQFGGYTGMAPAAFAAYITEIAGAMDFPRSRILMGADHLGPGVWSNETSAAAMQKAQELVSQCMAAGFHKIHLDTSFGCADDPAPRLRPEIAAERAAVLCRTAESAAERLSASTGRPLYVIGAEVPAPGGALVDGAAPDPTPVEELDEVIRVYAQRFKSARLESAWERVLAVVVQPGVDFGDRGVAPYRPEPARALSAYHDRLPGIMTYEIHSTDYQPLECLSRMVADHFILLKVGPCLTHAFREAVFALARIESEWLADRRGMLPSGIREVLEDAMLENPAYWQSHYRGSDAERRFLRSHSQRDRIRYYWSHPAVAAALDRLWINLKPSPPPELIAAHLPEVWASLSSGPLSAEPAILVRRRIRLALEPYFRACA